MCIRGELGTPSMQYQHNRAELMPKLLWWIQSGQCHELNEKKNKGHTITLYHVYDGAMWLKVPEMCWIVAPQYGTRTTEWCTYKVKINDIQTSLMVSADFGSYCLNMTIMLIPSTLYLITIGPVLIVIRDMVGDVDICKLWWGDVGICKL